ncbi:MAG: aminotransferase class V-fold PLP-dependent enzyme [Erysipelotrichaceae bacterium]|nr:aminotransferase class V-fold PLP-dependent enzyme [Erysipelotrichaceae bacterium]
MIYLDNAATSGYKPEAILERILYYMRHPGNPQRGVHTASMEAGSMVFQARDAVARFFHCDKKRVMFTSGLTESLNIVIRGLITKSDHVITTVYEHNSVLRPLYATGCKLTVIRTVEEIERSILPDTKAIIVSHVSNVTGYVQNLIKIGNICKHHHILFIVDAGQSAGVLPVFMDTMNIDILCFSGHKGLLGMQGIGGICLSDDYDIRPWKTGGTGIHSFDKQQPENYPDRLEAGTLNVPGIAGVYASCGYLTEDRMNDIRKHEQDLTDYCYAELKAIPNVTIYREEGLHIGMVSFNVAGMDAAYIGMKLNQEYDICIRTGAHCAPLIHGYYGIRSSCRVSFGIQNTKEEIDCFIHAIKEIIRCYEHM